VVTAPSGHWLLDSVVRLCGTCGLPITDFTKSARRSPTGWSHDRWGGWEGIRCPGRLTGAMPGPGTTTVGEWWAARAAEDVQEALP
jgi:hypothetical protein